jgi:metal-responsive CopG/Arc/MetJ family transcriptional regulator
VSREGWTSTDIRSAIARRIDDYLEHPEAQYGSRQEFVNSACRRLIEEEEARIDILETEAGLSEEK